MNKFLEEFLGTTDVPTYMAWFLLAFVGALASILIRAKLKYKDSINTPDKWSWSFLWKDNLLNLIGGFFITFIILRFSNEVLKIQPSAWLATAIGAANNEFALLFIKATTRKIPNE
jgi:hypothetical protein